MKFDPWQGESRQAYIEVLAELGYTPDVVADERPGIREHRDGSGSIDVRIYDTSQPSGWSELALSLTPAQTARLWIAFGV